MAYDFSDYYHENVIFFPRSVCEKFDTFDREMKAAWYKFIYKDRPVAPGKEMDNWDEAWKKISEDVAEVKRELEDEFRKILEVE